MPKDKTLFAVIGVILIIFGVTGTIPLAIKGQQYLYGLPITGAAIVLGVILMAWALND